MNLPTSFPEDPERKVGQGAARAHECRSSEPLMGNDER